MITQLPDGGYKDIFYNSRSPMLIMSTDAPLYTIIDVNSAYLAVTNTTRESLMGQSVFGAFPANPTDEESKNIERTIFSFEQAIQNKKPHTMSNYRYDIPIRGTDEFEERWWTTTNTPVLNEKGEVVYFIHSPENVTELNKLAEREKAGVGALKNQRKQLYSTFMQAPVGIGIFKGPDYVVDLVNPPLCELYAKTVDELMGKPIFDALPSAKGQGFEELFDSVRLTGVPFKGQGLPLQLVRDKGLETIYVTFVYEPFREDDGTIGGVIAVAIEITEQINARNQLAEAEERARLAVDAVGLGTFDLDLESGEMITSTLFANMFGFARPVSRSEYVAVFHPDDIALREKAHKDAITTGRLSYEARAIWKDKSLHWLKIDGKVFYNADKAVRILGTLLDVTEQRKAREEQLAAKQALADNEEFLRNITTAAPATLWTSDENGNINYVNQAWVDWTGRSFEENIGAGWVESIAAEDRQKVIDAWTKAFSGRTWYEVEFRINHSDGTIHWCIVTGKPQHRGDGSFTGYTGACVDITEQKHLQQQKDDFIGIASHELKTPVTSIKAYTQVLEKMLRKRGETKEAAMIGRMDAQINRLTSLIADLLDVTKINSGKLQFNNDEFDFNSMVRELVEDLQRTTDKHKLIENYTSTAIVYGDKERIGQVITNLITNAIKYSPHSNKINISTSLKNNELQLCVEDYGIGISKDKLGRVFEQFYRVSGDMQHTFPGLGLGLYISSEIIKREGGRIWVTSEEGKGSSFCFALPVASGIKI